jgi:hypothetical protein
MLGVVPSLATGAFLPVPILASRIFPLLASVLVLASLAGGAGAQSQPPAPPPAARPEVPPAADLLVLIRTTLVALNQANIAGNYSVLRDIAAPSFQANNTDANLAVIFAPLRSQRLDFSAIVALTPQLTEGPAITERGLLHLGGTFPMQPVPLNFEMLFQNVAGSWRLFGLSVNPPAPSASAKTGVPTKPAPAKKN